MIYPLFGFIVIVIGLLILIIGLRFFGESELQQRLDDFIVKPQSSRISWEGESINLRPEISGSILDRTIVPFFRLIGNFIGRIVPGGAISELDKQLVIAGNPLRLHGREFYGIRIIFLLLGGFMGYMVITRFEGITYFLIAIGTAVIIFYLPKLWLRSVVRRKQDRIRRSLPDALDMLSVCADAGLGFDQSLQRVSENWETSLASEFSRVVSEMSMGETRASAMRNMADRLDVSEVSSFVAVILQSQELGMSIAEILHSQANQMRIERRYWAQEQARKIPTKMLFPLMLLILPAMFAVIIGPIIPSMIDLLGSIPGF
ncbi:MAG: type II secretion system F family protein [Anaerolineales bacterium]|jgi:tight adherence protein C